MNNYLLFGMPLIMTLFAEQALASNCKNVYTIGAYDEAFEKQVVITKLGPLAANEVPPVIPQSFLEKDGSYGGGEVQCTIFQACQLLKTQLASGVLPGNENWHIYILNAHWEQDTYELHPKDYRLKHPATVIKLVRKNC